MLRAGLTVLLTIMLSSQVFSQGREPAINRESKEALRDGTAGRERSIERAFNRPDRAVDRGPANAAVSDVRGGGTPMDPSAGAAVAVGAAIDAAARQLFKDAAIASGTIAESSIGGVGKPGEKPKVAPVDKTPKQGAADDGANEKRNSGDPNKKQPDENVTISETAKRRAEELKKKGP